MKLWEKNLYTVWAIQILSLSGFGFGLPFLPFYIQELGITDPDRIKVWTGLMASMPGLTMGIMAPLWGMARTGSAENSCCSGPPFREPSSSEPWVW